MTTMKLLLLLVSLLCTADLVRSEEIEKIERVTPRTWYLGMNLNPADGHVMDYTTGWADNVFIGTYLDALKKDYLNREVWGLPVKYIAIVRHQAGEVDAVKVFRFKGSARSLLSRFQDMDPGREVVTEGGPIQESISKTAQNLDDDPVFSVGGDLAFNWVYTDNGHRIVLTGGRLSPVEANDDNTHGLGNDFACNPLTGTPRVEGWLNHEISIIQNRINWPVRVQGTDHGTGSAGLYTSVPAYGNYAIYVSKDASSFPGPGHKLDIEVQVVPKYKFF